MNICIISESIGRDRLFADFTFELASAAHDFKHCVTVLTSEPDFQHPSVEVLCPFTNWGVLEMKNGIAILETYRPDIIQIVQPHGPLTEKWVSNLPALLTFAKMRFGTKIVLHLLDQNSFEKNQYINSQLMQLADTVTSPGFQVPEKMQGLYSNSLVPLGFFRRQEKTDPFIREKNFLIPDAPTNWTHPEKIAAELKLLMPRYPDHQLLIASNWNSNKNTQIKSIKSLLVDLPVHYLSDPQNRFQNAEAAFFTPLKSSGDTFYLMSQSCMETKTPAIISPGQYSNFRMFWIEGENCHILDDLSYFSQAHLDLKADGFNDQLSNLSRIYTEL